MAGNEDRIVGHVRKRILKNDGGMCESENEGRFNKKFMLMIDRRKNEDCIISHSMHIY